MELGRLMVIEIAPAFRTAMRAAAMDLLDQYAADVGLSLQTYPGRPRTNRPPCAFVDRIREDIAYFGPTNGARTPTVVIAVLHGQFDSKDAVDQADRFVDGFLAWVQPRFHAAGSNTLAAVTGIEDEPTYNPEWIPELERRTYYATLISLEGYAGT